MLLSTLEQKLRSSADHASLVSADPADILWLESQRRAVVQLAASGELPVSETGQQAAVLALLYNWHCVHVTFVHKATDTSLPTHYTEFTLTPCTAPQLSVLSAPCNMMRASKFPYCSCCVLQDQATGGSSSDSTLVIGKKRKMNV